MSSIHALTRGQYLCHGNTKRIFSHQVITAPSGSVVETQDLVQMVCGSNPTFANILIVFRLFERCKHRVTLHGPCLHESFCVYTKCFLGVPCKHKNFVQTHENPVWSWIDDYWGRCMTTNASGCSLDVCLCLPPSFFQTSSRVAAAADMATSLSGTLCLLLGYWFIFMLSRPFSLPLFSCKYGC